SKINPIKGANTKKFHIRSSGLFKINNELVRTCTNSGRREFVANFSNTSLARKVIRRRIGFCGGATN
ncbi:MAG: hypothetical protein KKD69_04545, partial [Euryarchaeota archaeon]|nr:hypothetical protein [Euryarchaeota archaeon]